MKRLAIVSALLLLLPIFAIVGLVVFGTSKPPALLTSVTSPFSSMDYSALPPLKRYEARDGARLSYRTYMAGGKQVAVLIHGSAGSSSDMHALAMALQRSGVTVYVPDLRGHGANFPHGDIAYLGQLDDDVTDFLGQIKPAFSDAKLTLVGFSSGGGFALRVAADSSLGLSYDRYVLLSPYLRYDAPTLRTNAAKVPELKTADSGPVAEQTWAKAFTARIIGLTILNRFGMHAFDGLPVVAFAVPPNVASVTRSYSLRLQQNFEPHDDYLADIRAVSRPMRIFVGGTDDLFIPEKMQEVFHSQRSDIPVTILPGLRHSDMVTSPEAIQAVVATFQQ